MTHHDQDQALAGLLAMLFLVQTKSAAYRAAFSAFAAFVLGDAQQPDAQTLQEAALRTLAALNDQEGAAAEQQLFRDMEVFRAHYWTWYRSLAEGVMTGVRQHPLVAQILAANPQLCLTDALALVRQRN